ncbi:reverse transcriptase domain-containing protein [Tanacetum coccineum]
MTSEATHSKELMKLESTRMNLPDLNKMCKKSRMMTVRKINLRVFWKKATIHSKTIISYTFPNRVRKENKNTAMELFLENLKKLDINIPFIEALLQIPKYAKYLKSLLTNKSKLKEAYTETMNERCSAVLLNELPSKQNDPMSFTTPCQVFEKPKEAEDLAADYLYRFENPHMEVLTKREIADKFSDEHLMELKSKSNNDEPWYADFVNYIVGKVVPPNWTFKKRKRFFSSETLEILAHCHSGPTGGHHSAIITAKKVYESRFYWPNVFKDANEYVRQCDACQRSGNISLRNEMPQNNIQLNELAELRDGAYENTKIYKERTKKWHDSRLRGDKDFKVGDKVLLYSSRLKMYPRKLKSKWSGLNIVKTLYPHGVIEITDRDGFSFKVNE